MSYFSVDIYTPSRILAKDVPADSLTIPTCKGEIQVLPDHTHLITRLQTGILTLREAGQDRHYLVSSGVCKILGSKILILAKIGEKAQEVDVAKAKETIQQIQDGLKVGTVYSEREFQDLESKYILAETRIRLSSLKKT